MCVSPAFEMLLIDLVEEFIQAPERQLKFHVT